MEDVQKEEGGLSSKAAVKEFHFPFWRALRRKPPPDSPFFASGNLERELFAKQVILDITEEEKAEISLLEENECWVMKCPVVGCNANLNGLKELESHYFSRHMAMCSICSHVFPTIWLLDLHVSETHDSFFQAKAARGHPMYRCLVEGCDARFQSDVSRHQHLVDKHKFPESFQFHKKKHPSQKQRRRARGYQTKRNEDGAKRKESSSDDAVESKSTAQMDVETLTSAVSRLSTVEEHMPSQVTFGHRHNRAFGCLPRNVRGGGHELGNVVPKEPPSLPESDVTSSEANQNVL